MIDEDIIRSFVKGDLSQADILYQRYKDQVYSFFRYRGVPLQDAEDLTIEVFERVFSGASGFDTSRAFRPWFYQIMRNSLTDHFRSSAKKVELDIEEFDFVDEGGVFEEEEYKLLYQSLERLNAEDRELLLSAKFHRFPYAEIAESMSVSESVVKTRIHRTIKKLTSIYNQLMS